MTVVLGLPPALVLDIEVVGEPTIIGGEAHWLLFGGCPCADDDLGLAANDICVWLCCALPWCWGRFLRDDVEDGPRDCEAT